METFDDGYQCPDALSREDLAVLLSSIQACQEDGITCYLVLDERTLEITPLYPYRRLLTRLRVLTQEENQERPYISTDIPTNRVLIRDTSALRDPFIDVFLEKHPPGRYLSWDLFERARENARLPRSRELYEAFMDAIPLDLSLRQLGDLVRPLLNAGEYLGIPEQAEQILLAAGMPRPQIEECVTIDDRLRHIHASNFEKWTGSSPYPPTITSAAQLHTLVQKSRGKVIAAYVAYLKSLRPEDLDVARPIIEELCHIRIQSVQMSARKILRDLLSIDLP